MKPPKFKGLKRHHSAIFLAEDEIRPHFPEDGEDRIRILDSRGKWHWDYSISDAKFDNQIPCWLRWDLGPISAAKRMADYDRRQYRETIFLGYVRDTE